ncbi:hypothetical protein RZA67_14970 [Stenotrophomonas sp. C3(2023)]|uniref:hypothetical protein n=1 Tax=Stenotrophomonas sp. C3(2023) TaxID=3080277 RepID=UPI00293C4CB9|nr:hypothetical protein [Stenotrophomonas sp. C3(2023)]MDV3470024.1 hypothetical protein [Stenotrophomonas sp. C3(2023)]
MASAVTPQFAGSTLDRLDKVRLSLSALASLLEPVDHLGHSERGELAMLLSLLDELADDHPSEARHARTAVVDLIGSTGELGCVAREHLHALVGLLAMMQASALLPPVYEGAA